jgi:hypothetical protein
MLTEAVTGSAAATLQPDYDRIAAYHRRPIAARYAELLQSLVAKAADGAKEGATR